MKTIMKAKNRTKMLKIVLKAKNRAKELKIDKNINFDKNVSNYAKSIIIEFLINLGVNSEKLQIIRNNRFYLIFRNKRLICENYLSEMRF